MMPPAGVRCELLRIPLPRTWVNRLASWALTNRPTRRISMGDNCIARMPNSRVAPGAGDPHGPSLRGPRGESLELAWPSSSVGLNSFGPNPTANLVGANERGHSGPSGSVLGEPAPDRAARGGQPQSGYIYAASSVSIPGWPADTGLVTASPLWVKRCGAPPAFVVGAPPGGGAQKRWTPERLVGRAKPRQPSATR